MYQSQEQFIKTASVVKFVKKQVRYYIKYKGVLTSQDKTKVKTESKKVFPKYRTCSTCQSCSNFINEIPENIDINVFY